MAMTNKKKVSRAMPATATAKAPADAPRASRIAIYTGSFDPMTLGHLDVIRRASHLFDEVVVAIGEARGKTPLFSLKERFGLIRAVASDLPNVTVESFAGLAVTFAKTRGAVAMVRGIRSTTDYAYEVQMALMNRAMSPTIETIFFPTSPEFSHISSSLAKEIALYGGDLNLLVPPLVQAALAKKIAGKKKV